MKVEVTRNYILRLIDREVKNNALLRGDWIRDTRAFGEKEPKCVGCLVGNTFLSLAKNPDEGTAGAVVSAISNEKDVVYSDDWLKRRGSLPQDLEFPQATVCNYAPSAFDEKLLKVQIKSELYNIALSHVYESTYRRDWYNVGSCYIPNTESVELLKARVTEHFPKKFLLEVDGLELKDKLPAGVRIPGTRKTK